jgi:hypothetical protein
MNAPFLLMAQFAGRLDRRFSATAVVATGCLAAAMGVFALSRVTTTYRSSAVQSFVHGYHLAVGVAAACLLVAAVLAVIGLGRPSSPMVQASGSRSPTQSRAQKVSE